MGKIDRYLAAIPSSLYVFDLATASNCDIVWVLSNSEYEYRVRTFSFVGGLV